jgi:hypothetical protein
VLNLVVPGALIFNLVFGYEDFKQRRIYFNTIYSLINVLLVLSICVYAWTIYQFSQLTKKIELISINKKFLLLSCLAMFLLVSC